MEAGRATPKIGYVIGCHSKISDLLLHLEKFKYVPYEHTIIVVYTMDYPDRYMEELNKYHTVRIEACGHSLGPLLCVTAGVRKAHELGLNLISYNNADDHLFNFAWEKSNFDKLYNDGYLCAGYSWLSVGSYEDVTLNQLYLHVPSFYKTLEDAESYFRRSSPRFLCEFKIPRWIKRTCDMKKEFYRLPGREQEPGVGWKDEDIPRVFAAKKMRMPDDFWKQRENNGRYYNFEWRLIGSHNPTERLMYWNRIRDLVPYGRQIEKEPHFLRLVDAVRNNTPWNLPIIDTEPRPMKKPKLISSRIF